MTRRWPGTAALVADRVQPGAAGADSGPAGTGARHERCTAAQRLDVATGGQARAGDADRAGTKAVIALAVHRRRQAHRRDAHAAPGERQGRPLGDRGCGGSSGMLWSSVGQADGLEEGGPGLTTRGVGRRVHASVWVGTGRGRRPRVAGRGAGGHEEVWHAVRAAASSTASIAGPRASSARRPGGRRASGRARPVTAGVGCSRRRRTMNPVARSRERRTTSILEKVPFRP